MGSWEESAESIQVYLSKDFGLTYFRGLGVVVFTFFVVVFGVVIFTFFAVVFGITFLAIVAFVV